MLTPIIVTIHTHIKQMTQDLKWDITSKSPPYLHLKSFELDNNIGNSSYESTKCERLGFKVKWPISKMQMWAPLLIE
jgi:hypothetical protein